MFEKELVILGLLKQRHLLEDLIVELEGKPRFDAMDLSFYESRTRLVAENLKKLRKIKKSCCCRKSNR